VLLHFLGWLYCRPVAPHVCRVTSFSAVGQAGSGWSSLGTAAARVCEKGILFTRG
jgi:hypothetical protein